HRLARCSRDPSSVAANPGLSPPSATHYCPSSFPASCGRGMRSGSSGGDVMAEFRRTSAFIMHGARDAIAAGLSHVEEQVKGIEQAVLENPALAFDLAKTLVESTCRAILGERKIGYSEDDDLPRL